MLEQSRMGTLFKPLDTPPASINAAPTNPLWEEKTRVHRILYQDFSFECGLFACEQVQTPTRTAPRSAKATPTVFIRVKLSVRAATLKRYAKSAEELEIMVLLVTLRWTKNVQKTKRSRGEIVICHEG